MAVATASKGPQMSFDFQGFKDSTGLKTAISRIAFHGGPYLLGEELLSKTQKNSSKKLLNPSKLSLAQLTGLFVPYAWPEILATHAQMMQPTTETKTVSHNALKDRDFTMTENRLKMLLTSTIQCKTQIFLWKSISLNLNL